MTGREKITSAFSREGTYEIPAVICYDNIFIRDHWKELTSCPLWHQETADMERQLEWRREAAERLGQDWFTLFDVPLYSDEDRKNITIELRQDGIYKVDKKTGNKEKLAVESDIGGQNFYSQESRYPMPETYDEIDEFIPSVPDFDSEKALEDGRMDLSLKLLKEYGHLYPYHSVGSVLSSCYSLWGIEETMVKIVTEPELVKHACRRFLVQAAHTMRKAASIGAQGIWIEECYTDMISPDDFKSLGIAFMRELVDEIRSLGLKSIYYYTGNPSKKMDLIISAGADALAFEESKKNFNIDIEDLVDAVNGRCTLFGNLDSIGILQDGTEEQLKTEIERQITAGRRNRNRFVMSLGSPPTPATPVERVRLYCDLVHELGRYRRGA